ncbi:MAG: FIST C-terminal domain-containing protein [Actinomycetota bacterium]|nr:FIST C-terminal domain-containing protein [Actinomycetota bacterium]
MQFGAGLSLLDETEAAVDEALTQATGLLDRAPDLLLLFASPHHRDGIEKAARQVAGATSFSGTSAGCVAEGVIGGGAEVEDAPALSVWAAGLSEATWDSSYLRATRIQEGVAVSGWRTPDDPAGSVLIADPYSFPAVAFITSLGTSYPKMPVVGGLAAGGPGPGQARLIHDGEVHDGGAVAISFGGAVEFAAVVSQGCRPIGEPAVVTAARGNRLQEIGGKPALEFLQDLFDGLPPGEQELVRQGLQLGIVVDEYQAEFGRGDFLVRAVIGADPDAGWLTIGEHLEVGRLVQFQVRDPLSADEDLRLLLSDQPPSEGVLLFTCNGRGQRFFGVPHHDASVVTEILRPSAVAGFFAAGELGPVGGSNFLHGYTATLARLGSR